MKLIKIIIILLLALVLLLPFACQYIEEPYSFYQSHTDKLYFGNWVPKIFPRDIVHIHEQHDIDTNEVWVRFETAINLVSTNQMKELSNIEKRELKMKRPYFASWWFEGLIEQQPENVNALNAKVYRGVCGENMSSFLAISRTSKQVYWWCQ